MADAKFIRIDETTERRRRKALVGAQKSWRTQSQTDEARERHAAIGRLRGEADRLQKRIDAVYIDKLDGLVDDGFYQRMQFQWREERDRCFKDIERHHDADDSYLGSGIALLKLASEAHRIFELKSASEKRDLLGFLLSNCKWANGKLTATFKEPFDFLAETAAIDATFDPDPKPDFGKIEKWLGN